ncbi:vWA domain-containing protein [Desulfoscipio gibsoniae]|uniref:Mg-chelatase subunit ChlD n=1 Tax=Desulfoscipio gibsoniae DSM 7213 TaxID=767817 RepID=R4KEX0_9FIRM|nr:vWA domain-containing protein [Desulfoscipio gibsoniae]AGL00217.1 Mg-chelatase subunit ChlD [Desulfoscipio gibsoniae DSM 7213]
MPAGKNKQSGNVIKTFLIPGEEGYSEFWRRNKSPVEFLELANLLGAILKISGFMGRNVGNIIWSGMKTSSEENDIILDPSLVLGKYPIPGNKTDIVVGMAVHEAYKRMEWYERIKTLSLRKIGKASAVNIRKYMLYVDMAERIYVDLVANRSILGLYAEKNRNYRFEEARKAFYQPPTFDELLYLWWLIDADIRGYKYKEGFTNDIQGYFGYNLEQLYQKPMRMLNSITVALIEECLKIHSIVDRCEFRANLYISKWKELLNHTQFWIASIQDSTYLPKTSDASEAVSDGEKPLKPITAFMAKEIEAQLNRKNMDLTEDIRVLCQDDDVVPIEINDIVLPLKDNYDRHLLYRLQAIVRSHTEKRNSISRGMKSGKIDARRLYRAPLTGNIFMHKKVEYEMTNNIILVVDASGSMGGPKWKAIQIIFSMLYKALSNYNKNTRVFAYSEAKGTCNLTELSKKRGELYTVLPQGKTASGEAIIATAMMLKRKNKYPFIIHITDGASNWGSDVKYAINHCKKNKISLMTLGFGCEKNNKVALKKEYGNQVQFIDNLEEFPRKFGDLLAHSKIM